MATSKTKRGVTGNGPQDSRDYDIKVIRALLEAFVTDLIGPRRIKRPISQGMPEPPGGDALPRRCYIVGPSAMMVLGVYQPLDDADMRLVLNLPKSVVPRMQEGTDLLELNRVITPDVLDPPPADFLHMASMLLSASAWVFVDRKVMDFRFLSPEALAAIMDVMHARNLEHFDWVREFTDPALHPAHHLSTPESTASATARSVRSRPASRRRSSST